MALGVHVETMTLVPGVTLSRMQPGGKDGPHGEVLADVPGGQVWTQSWTLGRGDDDFQLLVPDIRMPANQYWPLHWHDCWIAIVVLDGSCLVGDWWMQPGDVLISAAGLEYGPLVNGPRGCQMFEVFAHEDGMQGGYALEYHDHPTLFSPGNKGEPRFLPRPAGSEGNAGNQTLPIDGTPGLTRGRLGSTQRWDLGEAGDPDRGVLLDTVLGAGDGRPERSYDDWRVLFVLDGSLSVGDRTLTRHDVLVTERGARVPAFEAGSGGAHLLEIVRTAAGEEPRT